MSFFLDGLQSIFPNMYSFLQKENRYNFILTDICENLHFLIPTYFKLLVNTEYTLSMMAFFLGAYKCGFC